MTFNMHQEPIMPAQTKARIAAEPATPGIEITPSQIKKTPIADLAARLKEVKRSQAAHRTGPRARRGITCPAKAPLKPFRAGTNQAAIHGMMQRPDGAGIDELQVGAPNWKPSSITSALARDLARLHGCEVWRVFDAEGAARDHARPGSVEV